jgi:hypothetical protein
MKKIKIDITNEDQKYWNTILANTPVLDDDGEILLDASKKPVTLAMSRGSLGNLEQRDVVLEYLELTKQAAVSVKDLPKGFSTSDELTERYKKEVEEESGV